MLSVLSVIGSFFMHVYAMFNIIVLDFGPERLEHKQNRQNKKENLTCDW